MDGKEIIDNYLSAMIQGFAEQAIALSKMKHKATKGQLREAFTQNLLKHFLPAYLDVGSGVIINNKGDQSRQTDSIIYDNRLLPAFLFSGNMNIYPVESVVAVIELKSFLNRPALLKAEEDAEYLMETVRKNNRWPIKYENNEPKSFPPPHLILPCLFGITGNLIRDLATNDNRWITKNVTHLRLICSIKNFSWVRLYKQNVDKLVWVYGDSDSGFKEVRRFIAILVDNLRTISSQNWLWSVSAHNDWLGQYIR